MPQDMMNKRIAKSIDEKLERLNPRNNTMEKIKEEYKNIGLDKNNLKKWQQDFIREFVNDH